mmetsp:Transcript_27611/g.69610  ORF Transcript_27611/g.69610 Transcript_27611/m.69610 type:complete len:232 (+) Transcript_27611:226-921(+)
MSGPAPALPHRDDSRMAGPAAGVVLALCPELRALGTPCGLAGLPRGLIEPQARRAGRAAPAQSAARRPGRWWTRLQVWAWHGQGAWLAGHLHAHAGGRLQDALQGAPEAPRRVQARLRLHLREAPPRLLALGLHRHRHHLGRSAKVPRRLRAGRVRYLLVGLRRPERALLARAVDSLRGGAGAGEAVDCVCAPGLGADEGGAGQARVGEEAKSRLALQRKQRITATPLHQR